MSDAHGHGTDEHNDAHGHDADADSHGGGHGHDDDDERPHVSHAHAHAHDDHAPVEDSSKAERGTDSWWTLKFDETTCFSLLGFFLNWSVLDWGKNGERKKVDLVLK